MGLYEFMSALSPEAKAELKALEDKQRELDAAVAQFCKKYPAPAHYQWMFSAAGKLRPWYVGLSTEDSE